MIREVFNESYVYPVIGPQDFFPGGFFSFQTIDQKDIFINTPELDQYEQI